MAKLKNRKMKTLDKNYKAKQMEVIYKLAIALICGLAIGFILKSMF